MAWESEHWFLCFFDQSEKTILIKQAHIYFSFPSRWGSNVLLAYLTGHHFNMTEAGKTYLIFYLVIYMTVRELISEAIPLVLLTISQTPPSPIWPLISYLLFLKVLDKYFKLFILRLVGLAQLLEHLEETKHVVRQRQPCSLFKKHL